jgi:hypothetical protein
VKQGNNTHTKKNVVNIGDNLIFTDCNVFVKKVREEYVVVLLAGESKFVGISKTEDIENEQSILWGYYIKKGNLETLGFKEMRSSDSADKIIRSVKCIAEYVKNNKTIDLSLFSYFDGNN